MCRRRCARWPSRRARWARSSAGPQWTPPSPRFESPRLESPRLESPRLESPRFESRWFQPCASPGLKPESSDAATQPLRVRHAALHLKLYVAVLHLSLIHISEPTRLGMISYAV